MVDFKNTFTAHDLSLFHVYYKMKNNLSRQSCFIWRTFMLDVRPSARRLTGSWGSGCPKWALKLAFLWDWSDWNMVLSMVLKPGVHPWDQNGHLWAYWRVLCGQLFQHFQTIGKTFMDMQIKQIKMYSQDVSLSACTTEENLSQVLGIERWEMGGH